MKNQSLECRESMADDIRDYCINDGWRKLRMAATLFAIEQNNDNAESVIQAVNELNKLEEIADFLESEETSH